MKFWQEKPFNPGWSLADIPDICESKIPQGLLPESHEDCTTIAFLKRRFAPPLRVDWVADSAERLRERLPLNKLCAVLARMARPYVVRERPTSSQKYAAQNIGLYRFIQTILGAADSGDVVSAETIHALICRRQLELIQNWPEPVSCPDTVTLAVSAGALLRWLGTMLTVALMEQVYFIVETLSPQNLPDRAIDYVSGKTPKPDWFLAANMRMATWRGDLETMEFLTTKCVGLPSVARAKNHYS